jgi:hypothetical protein
MSAALSYMGQFDFDFLLAIFHPNCLAIART